MSELFTNTQNWQTTISFNLPAKTSHTCIPHPHLHLYTTHTNKPKPSLNPPPYASLPEFLKPLQRTNTNTTCDRRTRIQYHARTTLALARLSQTTVSCIHTRARRFHLRARRDSASMADVTKASRVRSWKGFLPIIHTARVGPRKSNFPLLSCVCLCDARLGVGFKMQISAGSWITADYIRRERSRQRSSSRRFVSRKR